MKKNNYAVIASVVGAALLLSTAAFPAFAAATAGASVNAAATGNVTAVVGSSASAGIGAGVNVNAGVNVSAATATLIVNAKTRADEEITRRITALNALDARVNAMQKLSAGDKDNLSTTIQAQLTAMANLQAQITADAGANSTSSLKADIQSITSSYRIFALVIPQGAIEAASDRVLTVANLMQTLSVKLQARISAAQAAGNNVNSSLAAIADMNAKIADGTAQAQAAASEVAALQPDQGNATIKASNTAALKDARTKIQAAQQDMIAARADAGTIVGIILPLNVSAAASANVSSSAGAAQ